MSLGSLKLISNKLLPTLSRAVRTAFSSKYLLFTNVAISTALSGLGDTIEQNYEIFKGDIEKWDQERTRNMSITGVTVGILCHNYYKCLDKFFPGHTIHMVSKKIIIDQFICSPLVIATFFVTISILEHTNYEDFKVEFKAKGWRLYVAEWIIWPPAQFINFYFLPTKYRVLYDSSISLVYDIYTSYVKFDIPLEKKGNS